MSKSKSMALPDTLRIGGVDFSVAEIEDLREGNTGLNGHIRFNLSTIEVEATLGEQQKRTVIWHEVIHGILEHAGFDEHEERMVCALGYGIVQVLKDNEWLRG